jgi:hypothetical protein
MTKNKRKGLTMPLSSIQIPVGSSYSVVISTRPRLRAWSDTCKRTGSISIDDRVVMSGLNTCPNIPFSRVLSRSLPDLASEDTYEDEEMEEGGMEERGQNRVSRVLMVSRLGLLSEVTRRLWTVERLMGDEERVGVGSGDGYR